jgi:hypothetical protein
MALDPISVAMGLAQFAPTVVRWLSGSDKAEQVAQQVVAVAETVTGRAGPEAVQALQADPGLVLQFRQALAGMELEMERAYLADRQDARGRDVAYVHAGRRNVRADVMVALDAVGLMVCLVVLALFSDRLAGEAIALISTVASIFGLCLRDAHQFEFGSSRGSAEKTELLAGPRK